MKALLIGLLFSVLGYLGVNSVAGLRGHSPLTRKSEPARKQVPEKPLPFRKLGFTICRAFDTNGIPEDIVTRSPFGSIESLRAFVKEHEIPLRSVRRELHPLIYRSLTNARECFDKKNSSSGGTVAEVEWRLKSDRLSASVYGFKVRKLEGGDAEVQAVATKCLALAIGPEAAFRVDATQENSPFVQYDGVYPRALRVFFQAGLNLLDGRPMSSQATTKNEPRQPVD